MKFHLNPETGAVSKCSAQKAKCPFVGINGKTNHFDSIKEARQDFEKTMDQELKEESNWNSNGVDLGTLISGNTLEDKINLAKSEWQETDNIIQENLKKDKNWKFTTAWYYNVQKRKLQRFKLRKLENDLELTMSKYELARKRKVESNKLAWRNRKIAESRAKKALTEDAFSFHPEINEKNEHKPLLAIMAISGLTEEEILEQVQGWEDSYCTKTDAYRRTFRGVPIRTDKDLISVDLEVASANSNSYVDMGAYSSIIEVGMARISNGRKISEEGSLYGCPEDFLEVDGTGAEHIHNISVPMIKKKQTLVSKPETQKKLLSDLKGSVLVAHNAKYEISQLSHSIPGFAEALKNGEIEILDTRDVCTFFCPDTETNSNQSFVEENGVSYDGAHRALVDAKMTISALFALKESAILDLW